VDLFLSPNYDQLKSYTRIKSDKFHGKMQFYE
jgi:hypothetical protein